MRTNAELFAWYEENKVDDIFGYKLEIIFPFFTGEQQRSYGMEGTEWVGSIAITEEEVHRRMKGYMKFAWEKVLGHRGISASRSVSRMSVWVFLMGNDDLLKFVQDGNNYAMYGAPVLKRICEKYRFPIPKDERVLRMAKGLPCTVRCNQGCIEED